MKTYIRLVSARQDDVGTLSAGTPETHYTFEILHTPDQSKRSLARPVPPVEFKCRVMCNGIARSLDKAYELAYQFADANEKQLEANA